VILSSHILPEVSATCERVVIINQGRLVADDAPTNLGRRLSSGRASEIELVAVGDRDEILKVVEKVRGVLSVTINPNEDGAWDVVVSGQNPRLQDELATAIVGAGHGLRQLASRTLSLEDIFLELTADESANENATRALVEQRALPPPKPTARRRPKTPPPAAREEELDG
jgi:ABC-2 type transport system ATP-binding protein